MNKFLLRDLFDSFYMEASKPKVQNELNHVYFIGPSLCDFPNFDENIQNPHLNNMREN